MPSAWVISTNSGDCQSVMNPGWVSVWMAMARRPSPAWALIQSSLISSSAPIRCSVEMAVTIRSCAQPATRTCPPVTRPATRYEKASRRSPSSRVVAPCRCSTPSMTKRRPGDSSMRAPMRWRNRASSMISGSVAAFLSTVRPSASSGGEQHGLGGADGGVGEGDLRAPGGARRRGPRCPRRSRRPRRRTHAVPRRGSRPGGRRCGRRRPRARTPPGAGGAAGRAGGSGSG